MKDKKKIPADNPSDFTKYLMDLLVQTTDMGTNFPLVRDESVDMVEVPAKKEKK